MTQSLPRRDSEQVYIEEKAFADNAKAPVFHAFFTRSGGVSRGIYDSLNAGTGSQDDRESVKENRRIMVQNLGVEPENLVTVHQTHSDICLSVSAPFPSGKERPKADALATDVAGLAIGILTADCGPVLFYGQKKDGSPVIGAAHAGWGGAIGGILESTLKAMTELGAEMPSIRACVGPCIAQASYEVGPEFMERFTKQDPENEFFFKSSRREGHAMFDLAGYIAARLAKAGVKHVAINGADTYAQEGLFFSYRRSCHKQEPDYGRQLSGIVIKKC